jgi:hypothetical protein
MALFVVTKIYISVLKDDLKLAYSIGLFFKKGGLGITNHTAHDIIVFGA